MREKAAKNRQKQSLLSHISAFSVKNAHFSLLHFLAVSLLF